MLWSKNNINIFNSAIVGIAMFCGSCINGLYAQDKIKVDVCICLKKVDSQKESIIMTPHTEFQKKYYQQVIEIHQKTGFSPRKIAKLQLVPVSVRQMYHWIAIFEAENGKGSPRRIMEAKKSKEQEELESLKSRISELEESLRVERLRNRLNEKIIDIAEARWHIEIRKKAGTKR